MEDILPPLFGTLLFIAFLYFGYRDDYRRNKREFIVTIIAVPTMFLSAVLVSPAFSTVVSAAFLLLLKKKSKEENTNDN